VKGDVFLKVRNFGPLEEGTSSLSDGRLRIPKYTIFIGDQGTGKSTAAKLYSTFAWLEKAFVRSLFNTQSFAFEIFEKLLLNQNLSPDYVSDKTELEYSGNAFSFRIEGRKIKITPSSDSYDCPQIMYYPSERNIVSAVDVPWEIRTLPEMVYQLAVLFLKANMASGRGPRELWSGYRIEFEPETRKTYILDSSGKSRIPLSFASSGLESIAPLVVVSDYLFNLIDGDYMDILRREGYSIRAAVLARIDNPVLRDRVEAMLNMNLDGSFTDEEVTEIREKVDGLVNSTLIQIVEEPEQNLYPQSQVEMLRRLLSNTTENGKLLLTTHSPYIVSMIENYNLAWDRYMEHGKTVSGVEKKYLMRYEDTAAYLFSDGSVKSIMNDESRMIDGSAIDGCSDTINSEFDRILEDAGGSSGD
jgi:hypothetical protein